MSPHSFVTASPNRISLPLKPSLILPPFAIYLAVTFRRFEDLGEAMRIALDFQLLVCDVNSYKMKAGLYLREPKQGRAGEPWVC